MLEMWLLTVQDCQSETGGDGGVGHPAGDHLEHLVLPRGQFREGLLVGMRGSRGQVRVRRATPALKIASPPATAAIALIMVSGDAPFSTYPRAPARMAANTDLRHRRTW